MKKFNVIVIGSGAGLEIASFAAERGLSVALVEEGPLGGTCLNRGCIPSKMLIHSADVAEIIRNSRKFGIKSEFQEVDFTSIVKRVSSSVDMDSINIERAIKQDKNLTLFRTESKFIGPKQMQVGDDQIEADLFFIVGGTRPSIPPIPGLEDTPYLDSTKALRLEKQPQHLVILGGGYIAAELAHFYGALGTKITIVVRGSGMLEQEDGEIADWFTKEFARKYQILFETEVSNVSYQNNKFKLKLAGKNHDEISADQFLIATGRKPNTDILGVKASGIELDDKDYIKVNKYLETNVKNVWALGDIIGISPFRHAANEQARLVIGSVFFGEKQNFDPLSIGHAIFSSPQIAGIGQTEQELNKANIPHKIGRAELKDTAMGSALQKNGLAKVIADKTGQKILGVHIVGPEASILIHEAIVAMKGHGISSVAESIYVHPALSEWLQAAFFAAE